MSLPPSKGRSSVSPKTSKWALILSLVWIGLLTLVVFNRQNLEDWWRLRSYHPPLAIVNLATSDQLTAYARKVFYVNAPAIDNKTTFNQLCPNNGGEQTIVLGCYHSNQQGIYLLNVSDPRLNGVEQVTAAHEMLHAAYDRLNSQQKKQVDDWLWSYFNHGLSDQRIKKTMAAYKHSEPNDLVNEMHSVFGTEVANLPPQLENYYKRYFENRSQIVAYANSYQAAFTSLQSQVQQDDQRLTSLQSVISVDENDLKAKQAQLDTQRQTLETLRASNNFAAYNAAVPGYNAMVAAYNNQVATIKVLIDRYNLLVNARNAIALEEQQLNNELSSSVSTFQ
ncbi:MAG TPA: hypothetical protein VNE40_01695 [Candidatus Dormibacteraeota bacterium]|nr:hypothetical protein [Candidatus Dormibacteraeota bacterium]